MTWWQWAVGAAEAVTGYWATTALISWCKRRHTDTTAVVPLMNPVRRHAQCASYQVNVGPGVYTEVKIPDGRVIHLSDPVRMTAPGTLVITVPR